MSTQTDLALLLFSVILFGVVAGSCAALQLVSYGRSERSDDDDSSSMRFIDRFLEDPIPSYFALVLSRFLSLVVVVVAAHRFATRHLFDASGLSLSVFAFVLMAVLAPLAVAEIIALREPDRFVQKTRAVIYPLVYILWPIVYVPVSILRRLSPRLLDAFAFAVLPFKKRIELVGIGSDQEEAEEHRLMSSVFDFGDTRVKEVMVPRIDMVALNIHMPTADALGAIIDAGHSRIPVFDESIDRIVGVIHTKDLLKSTVAGREFSLSDIRRDAYFVPEGKMIDELLSEFKRRKIHVAIVVDEYGGTAGLITLEDVLEELVGDIQDEFDAEEELIERIDPDRAVCNARIRLDDLGDEFGLEFNEHDVDTLGGFLYVTLGRVPRVLESIVYNGLEFRIESVVRQRIDKVMIVGLSTAEKRAEEGRG